ncbi:MAG: transporter substrate-binding domain-containing protein [Opitutaceae bacterium]|nr:transporter substrate-binding domain-containing protein [Opitutaceae bacterium]
MDVAILPNLPTLWGMTRGTIAVVLGGLLALLPAIASRAQPNRGPLRTGVLVDNFPFSYRDAQGNIQGFAHDLTRSVGRVMDLPIEPVLGTTQEINGLFTAGNLDLLQSYAQFPEREEQADFSVPYLDLSGAVFLRDSSPALKSLTDLKAKKVLVHRGSLGETVLLRAGLEGSIVHVESVEQALIRLNRGEGDATLITRLSGLALSHHLGLRNLRVSDLPLEGYDVRYCFAVRDGDRALLAKLNEGLAVLVRTGEFDEIYQRWFGHVSSTRYTKFEILLAVSFGLAIALLVALWSMFRQRRLQERLARQAEALQQSQKMEAIGTLAGGVAHDFNNLLTVLVGNAEIARLTLPEDHPAHENINQIMQASLRAQQLVRQILAFSRQTSPERERLSVTAIIDETISFLRAIAKGKVEFLHPRAEQSPTLVADPIQVHQVLMNIGTNAVQAMRGVQGQLSFTESVVSFESTSERPDPGMKPGRYLRIGIQDTGPGMTPEVKARIFEPFFTTKARGEGTGLGLSVVHGILQQHGGAITVYSKPGRGTLFHLYFPIGEDNALPEAPQESVPLGSGQSILLVDDESAIARSTEALLKRLGYRVVAHTRPEDALAEFSRQGDRFAAVLTDLAMPGLGGLQLAARLRALQPKVRTLVASGFFSPAEEEEMKTLGIDTIVHKPMTYATLGRAVYACLNTGKPS